MGRLGPGLGACALLVILMLPVAAPLASGPPVLLPNQGPEVPPATLLLPVASVTAFEDRLVVLNDVILTNEIELPDVAWNRLFLYYQSEPNHPEGDPWDRTFAAFLGGVRDLGGAWVERPTEVLHGTTTRGNFDVTEDVTEYASILRGKERLNVSFHIDSWVPNGILTTVRLDFYDDATAPLGDHEYDAVVSPFRFVGVGRAPGVTQRVTFPDAVPSRATLELFTSGHGPDGEFWWMTGTPAASPPRFGIFVDGTRVGTVHAMPYVYALIGLGGGGISEDINQWAWWSAHLVLDRVGVHHGVGEIPSYRAELPAEILPLLTGENDVRVVRENHGGFWPTSVNFLLDA